MVAPPSDDPRRLREFPEQLVDCLVTMTRKGIKPRDIVTPASLRNALTVAIAMGGSTNVALHSVEIARAAGIDLWNDVISQHEFNDALASPARAHQRAAVRRLLDGRHRREGRPAGDREGAPRRRVRSTAAASRAPARRSPSRCSGSTRRRRIGEVIHSVARPFKKTGGLRLLRGNLAPEGGAILKVAGVEGGIKDGVFTGRARVFNSERALITALENDAGRRSRTTTWSSSATRARAARPACRSSSIPTSRITALCRQKKHHDRAHDRRALLRRLRRPRHRPRRAGGVPRRPDRARSRTATRSSST